MAEKCFDRRRLVIRGDHNNNVVTSRLHQALLEVTPQTEMLNLLAELQADVAQQDRLSILSSDDEMTVHGMNCMDRPTVVSHGQPSYRKPPEGVA